MIRNHSFHTEENLQYQLETDFWIFWIFVSFDIQDSLIKMHDVRNLGWLCERSMQFMRPRDNVR